eukprot:TRINITY_DN6505_c0_g1_i3.p1 TRINITY_DN6505_c0_g1~~TRINITY_DN6505_c0_g1_i3.p1  ORF type:complete len:325 (-),score=26.93 TRINITY_DN6505_c0_g1_i3:881-1789(-)
MLESGLCNRLLLECTPVVSAAAGFSVIRSQVTAALQSFHERRPIPEVEQEEIPEVMGYVHSTESFSAVDGPGVRFLTFLQGCAYRCVFCSNPDTWAFEKGTRTSSKDITRQMWRVRSYLKANGGGLTVSGGEALCQPEFTAALFREAHKMGVTTCLDTTGQGAKHRSWDVVLPHTDLVLFCIKHIDPNRYFDITGHKINGALKFVQELNRRKIPYWVRYVLIPSLTDDLNGLLQFIDWAKEQEYMIGVELLPYHQLGVDKWKEMGYDYPLKNCKTPSQRLVNKFIDELRSANLRVICDNKIH